MPNVGYDWSTSLSMSQLWREDVAQGCRGCNNRVNKASGLLQQRCVGAVLATKMRNQHVADGRKLNAS